MAHAISVTPYLFVGPIDPLIHTDFDVIISMVPGDNDPGSKKWYNFPIYDLPCKKLVGPASRAHKIICQTRDSHQKVYLCCRHGQSRSVMTCAWHLLWEGMDIQNIIRHFEEKGISLFDANSQFLNELIRYSNSNSNGKTCKL